MDEKTEELRDIFVETTGEDTVTERQRADRGSLADGTPPVERVEETIARMRERYDFRTDLGDEALARVAEGFFDGESDAALAETLEVSPDAVFTARMDLHLVGESDRDAPFSLDALRGLVLDGADDATCVTELDADPATVERYRQVVEASVASTRANHRFRDEFAELLTDADLSTRLASDAREDGLREATEDIETDVSF